MNKEARRYNKNKPRRELVPEYPLSKLIEVYTKGAHKYTLYKDNDGNVIRGCDISLESAAGLIVHDDGAFNWTKGQSWLQSMASVERHIAAWKLGEDMDSELSSLHLANAAWGLFSLMYYSKYRTEFDDRIRVRGYKKYAFDIDGVLCDFIGHFFDYLSLPAKPILHWNDVVILDNFDRIIEDEKFWDTARPLIPSTAILYEPTAYITARTIPHDWTENWLKENEYPKASLLCGTDKVALCKALGVEVFIDDSYDNYLSFIGSGIKCYLFTATHNTKYNVGSDRINDISEFWSKIEILG